MYIAKQKSTPWYPNDTTMICPMLLRKTKDYATRVSLVLYGSKVLFQRQVTHKERGSD